MEQVEWNFLFYNDCVVMSAKLEFFTDAAPLIGFGGIFLKNNGLLMSGQEN